MERTNSTKILYSVSSLLEKTESITYSLNDCIKKYGNEFYIKEINKVIPEINFLCINKQTNTLSINFLRNKRRRVNNLDTNNEDCEFRLSSIVNISDETEYQNINSVNSQSNTRGGLFEEKVKEIRSNFWEKEPFSFFSNLEDYAMLINYIFYANLDIPPHLRQPVKILNENLFDKELNKNIISLNRLENVYTDGIRIYSNSLYIHIFKHLENIFNSKKYINKICLLGEKGIGKTHALMLYSIFLRMNPYNLVFTIFNIDDFMKSPLPYFTNEVLLSLYYLYYNNNSLDVKDLEAFFSFYNLKTTEEFYENHFRQAFDWFKKMIEAVRKAYDNKINVYFIIDNYQKIYNKEKFEFLELIENFNTCENNTCINTKIITCTNTENNEVVLIKFKEAKILNDSEAIDSRIIFLKSAAIFRDEDFISFIEKRFMFTNKNVMKAVIKYSGYNYNHIISFFESISIHQYDEFLYLKDNHIRGYFLDIKKTEFSRFIDSNEISLEKKAYTLYSLFSYKSSYERNISNTHSKYDFFSKEIYKNYIYKYLHPEIMNNNIIFKQLNDLVIEFLLSFSYEDYFKRLKLKNMNIKCYADWYTATNDHYLKGIFIEELAFLFFKNSQYHLNQEYTFFYHRIENYSFYSKGNIIRPEEEIDLPYYSKINNVNNLYIQNGQIMSKIEKIKKFYSAEDQIFGGDKLLKFTNGIYFLNPKFPIIDAVVVNQERKNLILIQIKKTMKQKVIDSYFDDFHILYFLLENNDTYRKLSEVQMTESLHNKKQGVNTKLQLFMKLAHYLKNGWSINFMFTYRYIDNAFEFVQDNQILDNHYITYDKVVEAAKIVIEDDNYSRTEKCLGNFKIDNKNITLYRRRLLHNILMVDLSDFTNGLIVGKKFSNFIK